MNELTIKREYKTPEIIKVNLDNEISLQLESPATLPNESSLPPAYLNNDPFRNNIG
jgi:hypothetical protein